jgi:hypothetical protein
MNMNAQQHINAAVDLLHHQAHQQAGKYANELCKLKCAPDLLALGIYPNWKEFTESMGMYGAVREVLGADIFGTPGITLVAACDGSSPRTGAMFAFRSRFACYSIDPALKVPERWQKIQRLNMLATEIEAVDLGLVEHVIIAAVHPHATVEAMVRGTCRNAKRVDVFTMPCCSEQTIRHRPEPDHTITDYGIASPKREIRVWLDVKLDQL